MKTLFGSLFSLYLVLISFMANAQSSSVDTSTNAINQIFKAIPMAERLGETPQNVHELFSQNPFQLQASQNDKVLDLFSEAFTTDSLLHTARQTFLSNSDPESTDETLQWIQKPNTQEVLSTEKEFYTIEGIRKRIVHDYELEQNPPSQTRMDLIKSMIQTMSDAKSEIEARTIIFRAMLSALNEVNDQQLFDNMQMEGIVGNYRNQLQSQIEQEMTNQFLIMYFGLQDETLDKYASFYASEAGTWLNETTSKSMNAAYKKAADQFLKSVQNL